MIHTADRLPDQQSSVPAKAEPILFGRLHFQCFYDRRGSPRLDSFYDCISAGAIGIIGCYGALLCGFRFCPVFFYTLYHGVSADDRAGKEILPAVCHRLVWRTGRFCDHQPFYRFHILYNK